MKLSSSSFVADSELLAALEMHSSPVVCPEERILFRQGEESLGLYILYSGVVTMIMTSQIGESLLNTKVAPGALLGLPGVAGNRPYTLTAIASPGAELGFVTCEDFARMILANSSLSLRVLRVLAAEVQTARYAISEV